MSLSRGRKALRWFYAILLVLALLYVAFHRKEEYEISQLARDAKPYWLVLGIFFQLGTYLADAALWHRAVSTARYHGSLRFFLSLGFAKLFINQTVPTVGIGGTLFTLGVLTRRGVSQAIAMAAAAVDLLTYYAAYALAMFVAIGIGWYRDTLSMGIIAGALVFSFAIAGMPALLVFTYRRGSRWLPRLARRMPIIKKATETFASVDPALVRRGRILVPCTVYQLLIFAFDAATLWTMIYALGSTAAPSACVVSYMLGNLAKTLGFVPGGLGTFDAVVVATLHLHGVPIVTAVGATLLYRGVSFWLPLLPGWFCVRHLSRV